ncbi:MAG: ATP-binding protein [Chloroflexota bacterium]
MDQNLLENILSISRRMAETRAVAPLLDYVMDEAIKLVGAERGYIVLTRPDGSLDFRVIRNLAGEQSRDASDQISRSVLNQVLTTGEPLLLSDAMSEPGFDKFQSVVNLKLRSIMCVPLLVHGESIGAIYVENRSIRGQFDKKELAPLILFGTQAAISIENATLYEDLERRVASRTAQLNRAKQQVEESWAEAIEANRLRTVWLSNVTHDLRGSLSIVDGTLTLLQMDQVGPLNDKQGELIGKARSAIIHTLDLINDLFDLSKLESGGLTLYPEEVPLAEFLHSVYRVGLGLAWPDTVAFELNIPPALPDMIIDPGRIRQVLLNLVSNAHKFTTSGSVVISAYYQPHQSEVLFEVTDTGEGIPPDRLDRLFERFHQADENLERRQAGSGLGLAICHALVEMHEGRIWVESTLGKGSSFKFTLPLIPPAADGGNSAA